MTELDSKVVKLETRVDRAWDRYVKAMTRAQTSLDIRDGIEAGKAWSEFLAEFAKIK